MKIAALAYIALMLLSASCSPIISISVVTWTPSPSPTMTPSVTPAVSSAQVTQTALFAAARATGDSFYAALYATRTAEPTEPPPPTWTPRPSSTPRPSPTPGSSFNYDEGVTIVERKQIEDAIGYARKYYGEVWTLQLFAYKDNDALCEEYKRRLNSAGCAPVVENSLAFANGYSIFLKTSRDGWQRAQPAQRMFSVAHEYYHIVQNYLASQRTSIFRSRDRGPTWLIEGSAEFAAGYALYNEGLYDQGGLRLVMIVRARNIVAPLKNLETRVGAREAGESSEYTLGYLAADLLAQKHGGKDSILKYFESVATSLIWQDAFKTAFGLSVEEFYDEFEEYRLTQFPPRP